MQSHAAAIRARTEQRAKTCLVTSAATARQAGTAARVE